MRTGSNGVGLVLLGWASRFIAPLSAAQLIGCIGTRRCLVLLRLVGESTTKLRLLGVVH